MLTGLNLNHKYKDYLKRLRELSKFDYPRSHQVRSRYIKKDSHKKEIEQDDGSFWYFGKINPYSRLFILFIESLTIDISIFQEFRIPQHLPDIFQSDGMMETQRKIKQSYFIKSDRDSIKKRLVIVSECEANDSLDCGKIKSFTMSNDLHFDRYPYEHSECKK